MSVKGGPVEVWYSTSQRSPPGTEGEEYHLRQCLRYWRKWVGKKYSICYSCDETDLLAYPIYLLGYTCRGTPELQVGVWRSICEVFFFCLQNAFQLLSYRRLKMFKFGADLVSFGRLFHFHFLTRKWYINTKLG